MKFKDDIELKEIKAMVGKKARFRTARGPSMPHIIDSIELTKDGVVFVLKREYEALVKRRRPEQVELIKEKESKPAIEKPKKNKKDEEAELTEKLKKLEEAKKLEEEMRRANQQPSGQSYSANTDLESP